MVRTRLAPVEMNRMSHMLRRSALGLLLTVLAVGPAFIPVAKSDAASPAAVAAKASSAAPIAMDGLFPYTVEVTIAGRPTTLQLTGTAMRKAIGLKFFQIAGYCCVQHSPRDVDALAAADVPKQLVLVLERDIPESVLRRSFEAAFAANDPKQEFTTQTKNLLNHLTAEPLKKGDRITLTHLPAAGVECRLGANSALCIAEPGFAHVVWNVYMGPRGVCPVVRAGLGTRLSTTAAQ